jgi:hypothetical protein
VISPSKESLLFSIYRHMYQLCNGTGISRQRENAGGRKFNFFGAGCGAGREYLRISLQGVRTPPPRQLINGGGIMFDFQMVTGPSGPVRPSGQIDCKIGSDCDREDTGGGGH